MLLHDIEKNANFKKSHIIIFIQYQNQNYINRMQLYKF